MTRCESLPTQGKYRYQYWLAYLLSQFLVQHKIFKVASSSSEDVHCLNSKLLIVVFILVWAREVTKMLFSLALRVLFYSEDLRLAIHTWNGVCVVAEKGISCLFVCWWCEMLWLANCRRPWNSFILLQR